MGLSFSKFLIEMKFNSSYSINSNSLRSHSAGSILPLQQWIMELECWNGLQLVGYRCLNILQSFKMPSLGGGRDFSILRTEKSHMDFSRVNKEAAVQKLIDRNRGVTMCIVVMQHPRSWSHSHVLFSKSL